MVWVNFAYRCWLWPSSGERGGEQGENCRILGARWFMEGLRPVLSLVRQRH
jgi:hypothetical protein